MRRACLLLFLSLTAATWTDVQTPVRTQQRHLEDAAVIIGNRQYGRLPDVPYADRDADAFALWAMHTRGIPVHRLHRVRNGSRRMMERALLDAMRSLGDDGTLWVYYAGHGVISPVSGQRMLLGSESVTDLERVDGSAISLEQLLGSAEDRGIGHTVVIGDVSFVGANRDGAEIVPNIRYLTPSLESVSDPHATVWLAGDRHNLAAPFDAARQGLFTWAALGALRGWADGVDGERDGTVTLREATRWVSEAFRTLGLEGQDPVARVHLTRGDAVVTEGTRLPQPPDLSALTAPDIPPLPFDLAEGAAADTRERAWLEAAEADIRRQVQEKADADWKNAVSVFRPGSPDGEMAMRRFVSRYRALRYPLGDGDIVVTAEQVPDALAMLRGQTTPWRDDLQLATFRPEGAPAFQLADIEVTQHLWTTVMGHNPTLDRRRDKPVTDVSWLDAVRFCNALSEADGLFPAYVIDGRKVTLDREADGYRLPTLAEWQRAASPPADPCDANLADADYAEANDVAGAHTCRDRHAALAPARSFAATQGVHDLTGNAMEWVWDAADAGEDPLVARPRRPRLAVGGSFRTGLDDARPDRGQAFDRSHHQVDLGFRLARSAP
jgi:hypothetical protein